MPRPTMSPKSRKDRELLSQKYEELREIEDQIIKSFGRGMLFHLDSYLAENEEAENMNGFHRRKHSLSEDEETVSKYRKESDGNSAGAALQSIAIVTDAEKTSKDEVKKPEKIEMPKDLNQDPTERAKNKRMFGVLLGTLKKFQDEDKLKIEAKQRRETIEKKLEEKDNEEKQTMNQLAKELSEARNQLLREIDELKDPHEETTSKQFLADHQNQLKKYIKTQAEPHIFYCPNKLNAKLRRLLEEQTLAK
eukprot:Sdes_comp18409_c0_seq1m8252